ncbi:MAG: hypothetical protein ACT4PJ_14765 [Gemmatimonadaceae bacterium]
MLNLRLVAPLLVATSVAGAQQRVPPAVGALPLPADSMPAYVRQSPPTDSVIRRIWEEGTTGSQVAALAQTLIDSIGARLTGSPEIESASRWAMSMYQRWGIPARQHRYGTWPSWQRGHTHVDLISPRVRTLEAITLAWSPGTGGRTITGDVILLPDSGSPDAYAAWVRGAQGKFVLASPPRLSCRSGESVGGVRHAGIRRAYREAAGLRHRALALADCRR